MAKAKKARQDAESPTGETASEGAEGTEGADDPTSSAADRAAGDEAEGGADETPSAENPEPSAPAEAPAETAASPTLASAPPQTLRHVVARYSRKARQAGDFTAHAELEAIDVALAHLRQALLKAQPRLKGDARELVDHLIEGL